VTYNPHDPKHFSATAESWALAIATALIALILAGVLPRILS
jgi:hypothetical protein